MADRKNADMFDPVIGKRVFGRIVFCIVALLSIVALGKLGAIVELPLLSILIVFFLTMGISFIRGTDGLYLLIFAMLFSPEITSGFSTGRTTGEGGSGLVLRLEDIIMLAIVVGWVLRSAYRGRRFGIINTPVNSAIWIYMSTSVLATLLGVLRGSVVSFPAGLFNNLKYFEYFLLYFMILAHVRQRKIIVHMMIAFFIVFFMVMIYGYTQIGHGGRVAAPFDAEPNTFGGYIVLMMCIIAGTALMVRSLKVRVIMIFLILFALPPLLFTLSRASYLAFLVAFLSFLVFSQHRVLIGTVFIGILAVMMLGLPVLPEKVQERVAGTFKKERVYHVEIAGVDFDASSSARIISYQSALKRWVKSPLFGYGVTGTHFIDGQYPRLLVETGIIGLSAFLFIFWRLLRSVRKIYKETEDPLFKGLTLGFLCGIIAMLGHAISANSFIIVRIAEPFWLLAGLVFVIPFLKHENTPHDTSYSTYSLS